MMTSKQTTQANQAILEMSKAELRAMKYMAGYRVSQAVKHDTIDKLEARKLGRWDVNWLDQSEDRGRIFILTPLGKAVIKLLKGMLLLFFVVSCCLCRAQQRDVMQFTGKPAAKHSTRRTRPTPVVEVVLDLPHRLTATLQCPEGWTVDSETELALFSPRTARQVKASLPHYTCKAEDSEQRRRRIAWREAGCAAARGDKPTYDVEGWKLDARPEDCTAAPLQLRIVWGETAEGYYQSLWDKRAR